jgi:hypothetical protein
MAVVYCSMDVSNYTGILTFAFRPNTSPLTLDVCMSPNDHCSGHYLLPPTKQAPEKATLALISVTEQGSAKK